MSGKRQRANPIFLFSNSLVGSLAKVFFCRKFCGYSAENLAELYKTMDCCARKERRNSVVVCGNVAEHVLQ